MKYDITNFILNRILLPTWSQTSLIPSQGGAWEWDQTEKWFHWYLMNYESFNFTSAEFYLHRDGAAGLQLCHINNSSVYISNWGYYMYRLASWIWTEMPIKLICLMTYSATTVFSIICLATGDTEHLHYPYSGCIQFKMPYPSVLWFKPDAFIVDMVQ